MNGTWVVLHDAVPEDAPPDRQDTLAQADSVAQGLTALGYRVERLAVDLDLAETARCLLRLAPTGVFNLCESPGGDGRLVALAPLLLEHLGIPFSGSGSRALQVTGDKPLAKALLRATGIPTPEWVTPMDRVGGAEPPCEGTWICKPAYEEASVGLDSESALLEGRDLGAWFAGLEGAWFAERYIDGREFNVALLAGTDGPEVLPIAEICFNDFPSGRPRILDYRAKWVPESFEYRHTPRRFEWPAEDGGLYARLAEYARACWHLFDLRGYARVDFRMDAAGQAWVLEVNANPCLAPDAGFLAAAAQAGLAQAEVLVRILADTSGARATQCTARPEGAATRLAWRREVTQADPAAVRALTTAAAVFSAAEVELATELVAERLGKGPASGYDFLFAEVGSRLVGYTCFGPIPGTDRRFDLYWIAVDPSQQRGGLGRELLRRTEDLARTAGATHLFADTSGRQAYRPAHAFYQRMGYRRLAELPDFFADGDAKLVFGKRLASS